MFDDEHEVYKNSSEAFKAIHEALAHAISACLEGDEWEEAERRAFAMRRIEEHTDI